MKKAYITVGVSASGKTTWAQEFVYEQLCQGKKFTIIERDRIRADILVNKGKVTAGDGIVWAKWNWKWEKDVTAIAESMLAAATADPELDGVILADTNLNADRRAALAKSLTDLGYEVEEKFFDVSWKEAVKRDTARKNGVGVSVLAEQFARLQKATVPQYVPNTKKPRAVIVDVDGTLAHMQGRSAFAWDKVGEDEVDDEVRDVVRGLSDAGYTVIVMSGRDSVCRALTEEWLKEMEIPYKALFMRPAGDMRSDDLIKGELFWANVANKYNVKLVIDDRPQVLRFWRSIGLKTMALGNPLIEF